MSQPAHSFKLLRKKVKSGKIIKRDGRNGRVITWRDKYGKIRTGIRVKPRSHAK